MASSPNEPLILSPRRPKSASDVEERPLPRSATSPNPPPRRPVSVASFPCSAMMSPSKFAPVPGLPHITMRLSSTSTPATRVKIGCSPTETFPNEVVSRPCEDENTVEPAPQKPSVVRRSSLHDGSKCTSPSCSARNLIFESPAEGRQRRPQDLLPQPRSVQDISSNDLAHGPAVPLHIMLAGDAWKLPALGPHSISRNGSRYSDMRPKPHACLPRLANIDSLIALQQDHQVWRRQSVCNQTASPDQGDGLLKGGHLVYNNIDIKQKSEGPDSEATTLQAASSSIASLNKEEIQNPQSEFPHRLAEIGFIFTIGMTQLLAEYMISGFAIEIRRIISRHAMTGHPGTMGEFWPATLLSLVLSATLLIFARISDIYGGYLPFMFGVLWLGIWSLLAGFAGAGLLLDIARAMQGLAIAAFIPSTFVMVSSIYPGGRRRNFVWGIYTGCAPVGFFSGILVASALPDADTGWYFWIATALSFTTAITGYVTVPRQRTSHVKATIKMDWWGAVLITSGLILVAYALAVEPYAAGHSSKSGWTTIMVLIPLVCGLACLAAALWVEGWYMTRDCPLLPFDFFKPRSVKALLWACLCFYASYGVWLYESAQLFQSPELTGTPNGIQGVTLGAWYTPTAVGGLLLCTMSGAILHRVHIMVLFFLSALAWVGAPLLLALCPLPVQYWAFVVPSMLCATIGIDLTYTVSVIVLTAVQPEKYQGLAGAVASVLINLAMSFSLSISKIVADKAKSDVDVPDPNSMDFEDASFRQISWPFRAVFIYAAISASAGLSTSVLFVRISRSALAGKEMEALDLERLESNRSEAEMRDDRRPGQLKATY